MKESVTCVRESTVPKLTIYQTTMLSTSLSWEYTPCIAPQMPVHQTIKPKIISTIHVILLCIS